MGARSTLQDENLRTEFSLTTSLRMVNFMELSISCEFHWCKISVKYL